MAELFQRKNRIRQPARLIGLVKGQSGAIVWVKIGSECPSWSLYYSVASIVVTFAGKEVTGLKLAQLLFSL